MRVRTISWTFLPYQEKGSLRRLMQEWLSGLPRRQDLSLQVLRVRDLRVGLRWGWELWLLPSFLPLLRSLSLRPFLS